MFFLAKNYLSRPCPPWTVSVKLTLVSFTACSWLHPVTKTRAWDDSFHWTLINGCCWQRNFPTDLVTALLDCRFFQPRKHFFKAEHSRWGRLQHAKTTNENKNRRDSRYPIQILSWNTRSNFAGGLKVRRLMSQADEVMGSDFYNSTQNTAKGMKENKTLMTRCI